MKSQIAKVFLFVVCFVFGHTTSGFCSAVQTDPMLTSAIITQMEVLKKIYSRRDSTQKKIIAAEVAVTAAMTRMHKVEEKMLEYMSNVSGAFQNLYQIKRAGELVVKEIPANIAEVRRAIGEGHFEGTAVAVLAGQQIADMTEQMMSLYPFMRQLVTSGSYSTGHKDEHGKDISKKVNLLDSYERYYICTTVVNSLEQINGSLWLLAWEIRTMRFRDLLFALDPIGWYNIINMKYIVDYAVREWNYQLHNY
jgi:ribosomal protein L16/L10AE